ncbi:Glycosyltransferase involved in cell wall bisynthesis [Hathewaya proteolytica DSM 3090]|uniref:Glycosyltransferase involved in cell wall bisynthesis n=1 Tax=Hathewaya proteolytica DSM 3090 TaxID=1121331 RepID=A0A1M6PY48_9CLOT|nr:glycosyltransferase family 1 protein [Hathewaya proteolytica]SHK12821.1 Glycosyltransferase involved in cell wall bisynthesis [Hathewaya proteolytica DSM 3090]
MTKKNIYINATILHEKPSGLGVYAENVIKHLKKHRELDLKAICPIDLDGVDTIKCTEYVKPSYKKKGGLIRFLYTQFVMPFKVHGDAIIYHPFHYMCLFSRKKQIITVHDFIPMYFKDEAKHQNAYYRHIMPHLLKKAYKVICISENTKADLIKFYNMDESKIYVVNNGYDTEAFNTEGTENSKKILMEKYHVNYPYILMVGAEYYHKNVKRAMEAFKNVENKKGCKLVLIGKNSGYIDEIKSYAKELGIEDDMVFPGYVPTEHLKYFYNEAKAFLYPTLYEGFGLPVLEAWACNTLVLCSNNSSVGELAEDGAITFNPYSTEEIKNAIKRAIDHQYFTTGQCMEDIDNIKQRGTELCRQYDWRKTADEVAKIIYE